MYTDGKIIIEKKKFTIKILTAYTEIIYVLETEEEACSIFIALILESERKKLI